MQNALGEPQTLLLLGGTSDIGVAIVRRLLSPATRTVVLACRDTVKGEQVAAGLRHDRLTVEVVAFEAGDPASHAPLIEQVAARHGDIDLVVLAFAVLGDGAVTSRDPVAAADMLHVNVTGTVSSMIAAANQLRSQGHGSLVVLSSVAGERVRRANPVYGGSKAGVDGVAQGLADALADDGVHVMIVRPGFVHSAMTVGLEPAPFATTPEAVADCVAAGLRARRRVVWAPGLLRWVFVVMRHLPGPVWRRVSAR